MYIYVGKWREVFLLTPKSVYLTAEIELLFTLRVREYAFASFNYCYLLSRTIG